MKPILSWSEYCQLELISASACRTQQRDRILYWLYSWQQWLSTYLQSYLQSTGQELQIWSTRDASETLWWSGYDPQTGRSIEHVSEAEIRRWVEQRYLF